MVVSTLLSRNQYPNDLSNGRWFFTFAGLVSLATMALVVYNISGGQSALEKKYSVGPIFLAGLMLQGSSCLTLFQAFRSHAHEEYLLYRNWLAITLAMSVLHLILLVRGCHVLFNMLGYLADAGWWVWIAGFELTAVIYYAIGVVSLMRILSIAFSRSSYIEGFLEGLNSSFALYKRRILTFWVAEYAIGVGIYLLIVIGLKGLF
jgi:hypothetical protein